MVDKITTVRRARLDQYVGRLSAAEMVAIERLVIVFLGLAA
jgi:mRNA-degrading endonuclease toxin of MazEF toxin-antitoxin module